MKCEQAELRMGELLAGEINAAGRAELDRHLLDCAACRDDFRLAREGWRADAAEVPVPHEVIQGTLAALREPPALVRVFRWGTAAAALISVAVLLISSSRTAPVAKAPAEAPLDCNNVPRETVLATMQEPGLGAMVCTDDQGQPAGELGLKSHEVSVEILDGIAKTTVEENFENHTERRLEGKFNFPLPSDASISRLALEVNGKIEEGTCLERERARQVFESIVRRMQDPALLEWQPGGYFSCRVFPIEPRSTKRVIVAYTQTLPCFQGKMTYVYPLASEKTRKHPPGEVRIDVRAKFTGELTRLESTSHHLDVQRKDAHEASMSFRAANYRPKNDFVVALEPKEDEVRVVCHKPADEGGYFACFATPASTLTRVPQKYSFVLDASASISAPRLEAAKRLVRAMMERRIDGDRFEVIAHSVEAESSGEVDLRAANAFMDRLAPIGGSDVLKALRAASGDEVLYIGKGQPTFGETETSAILEAVKGRRIRAVAVGSDANLPLLERLGGLMRISPNDELDKRVGEIAATLGSPVITGLKVEGDNVEDVGGTRDVFAGERLTVVGRYKAAGASKVVLSGRGYRREIDVVFPEKEEANNPVRRLWAQRRVSDLLAHGEATRVAVTALGEKFQIMTPYTSFLVLESEQMWRDHQLKREVQKQDSVLGKRTEEEKKRMAEAESSAHEIETKRMATRTMAKLLNTAFQEYENRYYDRTIKTCDELLKIDPHYPVAKELKDWAEKTRHKEMYTDGMKGKIQEWRKSLDTGGDAAIPSSNLVRFPSREEWSAITKQLTDPVRLQPSSPEMEKITQELARGRSASDQQAIYESQRHYEQALMFNNRGDFDKAKTEAQKAVEAWRENTAARKLINDVSRITIGGQAAAGARSIAEDARDDFRVRTEQAQIEITKHVRDGERYLNARMYDQAKREFENAEFKIQSMPFETREMTQLLPGVKDSIVKTRNAQILEGRRTEEEKKRFSEAEAAAPRVPDPVQATGQKVMDFPSVQVGPGFSSQETPRLQSTREWDQVLNRLRASGQGVPSKETVRLRSFNAPGDGTASMLRVIEEEKARDEYRRILVAPPVTREGGTSSEIVDPNRLAIERKLDTMKVDLSFENTKVEDILGFVRDFSGLNIVLDASVRDRVDPDRTVDFTVRDKPVKEVLSQLLKPQGLEAVITDDNVVLLTDARRSKREVYTADDPDGESSMKAARINELQRQLDSANTMTSKYQADMQVFVRQLELQLVQIEELKKKSGDARTLEDARHQVEQLKGDLSEVEKQYAVALADKQALDLRIRGIALNGGNVNCAPRKALAAKVTIVALDASLVTISVGKDDGVIEGDEFSILRNGTIFAKIVITSVDRKAAIAKIVMKTGDPNVGDDVSNALFLLPARTAESVDADRESLENLRRIRIKMGSR